MVRYFENICYFLAGGGGQEVGNLGVKGVGTLRKVGEKRVVSGIAEITGIGRKNKRKNF